MNAFCTVHIYTTIVDIKNSHPECYHVGCSTYSTQSTLTDVVLGVPGTVLCMHIVIWRDNPNQISVFSACR